MSEQAKIYNGFSQKFNSRTKRKEITFTFLATVIIGLLTHAFLFVNKLPNADAMDSFWFDQNMVTSGRWFLTVTCGISSFYDLNWINGVLSLLYLGVTSVVLCSVLSVKSNCGRVLVSALLVTFPAVTATFAYLYTADGYMLGLLFSVLAVYIADRMKPYVGILLGGALLSLSIGTYQAYTAVTILLCIYLIVKAVLLAQPIKTILLKGVSYLGMGITGGVLYLVILKICLFFQHKELDTYQGISSMGKVSLSTLPQTIYEIYYDFAAFAVKGNIFVNNGFSLVGMLLLGMFGLAAILLLFIRSRAYRKWYNYLILAVMAVFTPIATNIILLVSADAYYHLLMRMQWVLFPIFAYCLTELYLAQEKSRTEKETGNGSIETLPERAQRDEKTKKKREQKQTWVHLINWVLIVVTALITYNFIITDNIAYFNMNERYEKTYAYCIRLIDRMEQTPGYVPGMKVAMIGELNQERYPDTDITAPVTARITGTTGSILLYKGVQYQEFMKHYMNVTINMVDDEERVLIYNSEEYQEMGSFPDEDSIKVVDGIMYIKTE